MTSSFKPWGLGQADYARFRSLVAVEIGYQQFDRLRASEPEQGKRSDIPTSSPESHEVDLKRNAAARRRAVNRAPAPIQALYDRGLLKLDLAARFGKRGGDEAAKALQTANAFADLVDPRLSRNR